jgi:hypothetical protein
MGFRRHNDFWLSPLFPLQTLWEALAVNRGFVMIKHALIVGTALFASATAQARILVLPTFSGVDNTLRGTPGDVTAGNPAILLSFDVVSSTDGYVALTQHGPVGSVTAGQLVHIAPNKRIASTEYGHWFTHISAQSSPGVKVFATFSNVTLQLGDDVAAIPEPATWALMIAGFGLAGSVTRHRRKAEASAKHLRCEQD